MLNKGEMFLTVFFILMAFSIGLFAKISPVYAFAIQEVMVTDVTPASFSVVWLSDLEVVGDIELFQDNEGLYPEVSHNVIKTPCSDEQIFSQAASNGIIKIKVEGLTKDTAYYFRLTCTMAEDANQTAVYPEDNSLIEVITENEARLSTIVETDEVKLMSNLMMAEMYQEDKVTPADSSLVVASISGASYPISAYVGEGALSPGCILDLYNLFDQTQHTTMEPIEGSEIIFFHYKGQEQTAIRKFFLPAEFPEAEPIRPVGKEQDIFLAEGLNYISFQVDPENSDQIHTALTDKFTELWTFKNGTWIDLTYNDSCVFYPNQGYLITATEPVTLTAVGGWRIDPIPLDEGLNIIGYRSEVPMPVEEVMAPLVGKYTCIWGYSEGTWRSYDPRLQTVLNTLTEIVPGKSYYLNMKEAGAKW